MHICPSPLAIAAIALGSSLALGSILFFGAEQLPCKREFDRLAAGMRTAGGLAWLASAWVAAGLLIWSIRAAFRLL